ncbi:TPA: tRNA-dependent cyclodipeptide synthase [Legionella pneumophila]
MDNRNVIVTPHLITSLSSALYQKKEHVLLGISPFNSYFSEEMIGDWIQWAQATFSSFHVFIPDTLPVYTFLALGYDEFKAKKKAKKQASYLKNKVARALVQCQLDDIDANKLIIDMDYLENNEAYIELKKKCYALYNENPEFQKECDQCTGWVLNGHAVKDLHLANENIAVQYILNEMPLFMDTPSILNTASSLFSYHQTPQFINYLYNDHRKNKFVALNQGYIELSVHTRHAILDGVVFGNEL